MELSGKSDETIKAATGKTWRQWIGILDKAHMQRAPHKEIVQWLWDKGYAGEKTGHISGWWVQTIVVGYEQYHKRRVVGQTADAGFQIGVQKVIHKPAREIWAFLTSDAGLKIWLSPTASLDHVRFEKGAAYELPDGTKGIMGPVHEAEKLRLQFTPAGRASKPPTTLQFYLDCNRNTPNKTNLGFHQEKLASAAEREKMRKHWREVLEELKDHLQE